MRLITRVAFVVLGQVEGAAAEGGKGISIWDDFTMRHPGLSLSLEIIIN